MTQLKLLCLLFLLVLSQHVSAQILSLAPHPPSGLELANSKPIIHNGLTFCRYQTTSGTHQLARFNGATVTLVPNINTTDPGYSGMSVVCNNVLYILYLKSNGKRHLARYNNLTDDLTLIDNANTNDVGVLTRLYATANQVYCIYLNANNKSVLARYDGISSAVTLIPNANNSDGGIQNIIAEHNGKLFVSYLNSSSKYQLAWCGSADTNLTLVPNVNSSHTGLINSFTSTIFGGELYFKYNPTSTTSCLAKYNGLTNALDVIANANTTDGGVMLDMGVTVFNGELYCVYRIGTGNKHQLAKYTGTGSTLSYISNDNSTDVGVEGFVLVHNNMLYFKYKKGTKGYLGKYDGFSSAVSLVNNPNIADPGYNGESVVFNNELFGIYSQADGKSTLVKYDGIAGSLSVLPNPGLSMAINNLNSFSTGLAFVTQYYDSITPAYNTLTTYNNGYTNYVNLAAGPGVRISYSPATEFSLHEFNGQILCSFRNMNLQHQLGYIGGCATSSIQDVTICQGGSFSFNGQQLTTAGTYYDTLINAVSCDSLVILNLDVETITTSIIQTICIGQTYTFNGQVLSTSGVYKDTLITGGGCDSVVTLTLDVSPFPTINNISSSKNNICPGDSSQLLVTPNPPGSSLMASTFSGSTIAGYLDGPPTVAKFSVPNGITSDGTNLYITEANNDYQAIRKINIPTGEVSTLASGTASGYQDGFGSAAKFANPYGIVAVGSFLYVTDEGNSKIRKINIATQEVTTFAGSSAGYEDGSANTAKFSSFIRGLATDGINLYVADVGNHVIRKVVIATAEVSTLAGSTQGFVNGPSNIAKFNTPWGVATDGINVYVSEKGNDCIRKIVISTGVVSTLAGGSFPGELDGIGPAARFSVLTGITTDGTSIYTISSFNKIRKIDIASATVTTLNPSPASGYSNGPIATAGFSTAYDMTLLDGSIYLTEAGNNCIRRIGAGQVQAYSWLPNVNVASPYASQTHVFPNLTTTYTVTASNTAGCTLTATTTVHVLSSFSAILSNTNPGQCGENGSISIAPTTGYTLLSSTNFSSAIASPYSITNNAGINNGQLQLTSATNSQQGALIYTPTSTPPDGLNVSFDMDMYSNQAAGNNIADGMSFNYGVIPASPTGNFEDGILSSNNGLAVRFKTWQTQRVEVVYQGIVKGTYDVDLHQPMIRKVQLAITPTGLFSMRIGNKVICSNLNLGATYAADNKSSWKIAWAARTGGSNNRHAIDNVEIVDNHGIEFSIDNWANKTPLPFFSTTTGSYTVQGGRLACTSTLGTANLNFNVNNFTSIANVNNPSCNGRTLTISNTLTMDTLIWSDFASRPTLSNFNDLGNASFSNGSVQLTDNTGGQNGRIVFPQTPNAGVFTATFKARVWDGNNADGFSFNYGQIDNTSGAEGGMMNTNTPGLSVGFPTWNTNNIIVKYKNNILTTVPNTGSGGNRASFFTPIEVSVNAQYQLTVKWNGTTYISNYDLVANSTYETDAKTNWQFAWGARTGGQYDRHQLDDILVTGKTGLLYSYDGGSTYETNATKTIAGTQAVTVVVKAEGTCNSSTTNFAAINNTLPVFTPIADICSGTSLAPLPTTSNNGIVGTWSPALNNSASTTYTFTPNAGQCAATTTLTINVKTNYTITANAGANGNISPAGNSVVCTGSNMTYNITPNAGYSISNVLVNGVSVGAVTTYTFTNVLASQTIAVSFVCVANSATINQTICSGDTLVFNGLPRTTSGMYIDTLVNLAGCDSILTLNLTVTPSTSTSETRAECYSYTWPINNTTYTTSGVYTYSNGCHRDSLILTIQACKNLKVWIQGYYQLIDSSMQPVLFNTGLSASTSLCDSLTVELHDALAPNNVVYTTQAILHTDGTIHCRYPEGAIGDSYYLVLTHRNAIETWSANPELFQTTTTTYDFSTGANQAYGGNQVQLTPSEWGIYSGDVNHDLTVDVDDYLILDADLTNGATGYVVTDINGDASTDLFDYLLMDGNIVNGISTMRP